jgi:predicted small lipoprotein YifL
VSSAPRTWRVIAAAAVAGALAACGATGPSAHPAVVKPPRAAAVQVRVQSEVTGWSRMVQRPHVIYIGMGGAPVARQLAWRHWGSPQAWASGQLDIYWRQPGPISGWHPTSYPVTVRLQDIQTHNGQPSYRKMTYRYVNRRGIAKTLQFEFAVQPGGSVPSWNPPSTKPGLA